jgi:hypothetical protein
MAHFPDVPLEEFAAMTLAIEEALRGDFAPLVERLRTKTVLLPIERNTAADIIEGKLRPPKHRLARPALQTRNFILALNVAARMSVGVPEKCAVAETADEYGVEIHTVRDAIKKNPQALEGIPRRRNKSAT